ncbi:MAG: hypothetical protein FWE35_14440 [Streptosporangiales bacterium]|nr:hypothetical protein [Streptosporangiales bacterium]
MARVLVWVCEGTWPAVIDAVRSSASFTLEGTEFTLIHVDEEELPEAAHGAVLGLFGRGHSGPDPASLIEEAAEEAAASLLDRAAARLDRPCARLQEHGHPERIVVSAAADHDLLILARDGDVSRLGPKSLGKHGRFVVDHAPCRVLLVWPVEAPAVDTIPPKPPHPPEPPGHPGPPHPPQPPGASSR